MKQLAIKGHVTRGREVIKILEMLGGKNKAYLQGTDTTLVYYICSEDYIDTLYAASDKHYKVFTLEEFLEKFPYKVGDKVLIQPYVGARQICEMRWDSDDNCIKYGIGVGEWINVSQVQPYKEETMEEQNEKSVNHVYESEVISFDIAPKDKYELDLQGKFEIILREGKYFVERIKPRYPKTYEECCKVLCCKPIVGFAGLDDDEENLYGNFIALKRCRDAYWKIAGDWKEKRKEKAMHYVIYSTLLGEVVKDTMPNCIADYLLDFPTEEMRDAFKENFDGDIDLCKEFL